MTPYSLKIKYKKSKTMKLLIKELYIFYYPIQTGKMCDTLKIMCWKKGCNKRNNIASDTTFWVSFPHDAVPNSGRWKVSGIIG